MRSRKGAEHMAAELSLRSDIGTWEGATSAEKFATQLAALNDADEITFYLNCNGGCVFNSLSMMSMLQRHPAKITCVIEGLAASAGTFLPLACSRIVMSESSW